jgi:single-strand DNA-binding protein
MEPQIEMQGNLVADPVYRTTAAGVHMTKFRIASSGRRWDRQRDDFVNTDPVYMSVVCWRQLADNVAHSLRKGDTVLVHGRLMFREYEDANNGPRRQAYEIYATAVGPDLARYKTELIRPVREIEPLPAETGSGAEARLPRQTAPEWVGAEPAPAETAA